jgi:hypothetical protein
MIDVQSSERVGVFPKTCSIRPAFGLSMKSGRFVPVEGDREVVPLGDVRLFDQIAGRGR